MEKDYLWEFESSITYTVEQVATRGWTDVASDVDNFAVLRKEQRFREAQVAALYEQYFLPERHEFEWQVLNDIAGAVVSSPVTQFAGVAIAGGVIGNAAYDLLKKLSLFAADLFEEKLGKEARERASGFKQLAQDVETVKTFFSTTPRARIEEIERSTSIPRERIHPIMKLVGLRHYRRENACYWEMPAS